MKHLYTLLLSLMMALGSHAQTPEQTLWNAAPTTKYEVRAVWLTTIGGIDWPHSYDAVKQREEMIQTLDRLKQAGINMVLVQTRVRATTIYPSAIEPWDGCVTGHPGRAPGYDPLQLCIDLCHERGMECHAWVVTIPVGKWNNLGCKQLRQKYPRLIKHIGDEGYMDPEQPQTGDYLARMCTEIVRNYDVDGIHLDYIRYPETWPKLKRGESRSKRIACITDIVRKVSHAVKSEKPWVKMSCSPIGKYDDLRRYRSGGWNARTAVSQDAQAWLRDDLMDALFPMMYFQGNNFYPFAIDWQEQSHGRMVVPGLGIYFLDPKEGRWTLPMVERQLHVLRQLGLGHCYFRSKFFTDNTRGIYDFSCRFDATPTLIPPMTWANRPAPKAPTTLSLQDNLLSWSGASDPGDAPYLLYNVYASDRYPVDTDDPHNLVATRRTATSLLVSTPQGKYYAVTAMNRYGQESPAIQMEAGDQKEQMAHQKIQISTGLPIILPTKGQVLDADYVIVESMTGQQISVRPYTERLSVESLPDGMYCLRSLGKKGRTHRIGYFTVYRKDNHPDE
ncbi:MAG: family 10 glycosylhydrolase [Prevotella sp.]|nr:family 10 glycosylhydrolase [Prevotella sp.]